MTLKKTLLIRNLLALICLALLLLIAGKLYMALDKIQLLKQAQQHYEQGDLVTAEDLYMKASANRAIDYKEEELAAALKDLAYVTAIKSTVSAMADEARKAMDDRNFEQLKGVYDRFRVTSDAYGKKNNDETKFYKEAVTLYGIKADLEVYFKKFAETFDKQMADQIKKKKFDDDAFKNYMTLIPAEYYGGDKQKKDELAKKLAAYDEARINELAGGNELQKVLNGVQAMMKQYGTLKIDAPWLKTRVEDYAQQTLQADLDKNNVAAFANHAKSYEQFVSAQKIKSKTAGFIAAQITALTKQASAYVKNGKYEEALALYDGLGKYKNMDKEIAKTNETWLAKEPARLLEVGNPGPKYVKVANGNNRWGAKAYAAAVDEANKVYFGVMKKDGSIEVTASDPLGEDLKIKRLVFYDNISPNKFPVIVAEGSSSERTAKYVGLEVLNSGMRQLFDFEADGFQVEQGGMLLVNNAVGEGAGKLAYYSFQEDGTYYFSGIKPDYTDIALAQLLSYENKKVRFECNIVAVIDQMAIAEFGDGYIVLEGPPNTPFVEGYNRVVGTLHGTKEIEKGVQTLVLPKVDVESVE